MLSKIKTVLELIDFPYKGKMAFAIIGSALVSIIEMLGVAASYPLLLIVSGADLNSGAPGVIARLFNTSSREQLIIVTSVLVVSCFIVKSLVAMAFRWWQLGFVNSLEKTARTNLFKAYLEVPFLEHRAKQVPDLHTNLVTAVTQSFGQVILGIISFFSNAFTALLLMVVMFVVSPLAATVAFVLFAGAGSLLPLVLRKKLNQVSRDITEADRISWFASIPAFQAFREMRLFSVAENFVHKYESGAALRARTNRRSSFYSELPKYLIEIVFVFGVAGLALLLFTIYTSEQAISVMGVFTVAAMRMMPSINASIATANVIRAGSEGLNILSAEVNQLKRNIPHSMLETFNTDFTGDIQISDVSFGYSPDKMVLDGISMTIPQGHTVAFVGSSGSGKSTLVDLILGLLPIQTGQVYSGGKDIHSDLRAWQKQLGVVPQSVVTIPGTLRDNVAFGINPNEINDELVYSSIEFAGLTDLVETFEQGLYEDLGQDGNRLSGGQKQRLGIARALYRNPRLLVMDEATSALDNKTEHKITQTVEELSGKVTTIIVAHRLSTIKNADQIYYLQHGKIIGQGTFTELSERVPEFAELVRLGKI